MNDVMALVVGWTLVGAFIFTVIVTLLSLIGWMRFADPEQQKVLFGALVVELVLGFAAGLVGVARYDPNAVAAKLRAESSAAVIEDLLNPGLGAAPQVTKAQLEHMVGRIDPGRNADLKKWQEGVKTEIQRLPPGILSQEAARQLSTQFTLPD